MASFYRREILQQALTMIWRKKYLWWLGLFAGLATYGGEINFLLNKYDTVARFRKILSAIRNLFFEGQAQVFLQQLHRVWTTDAGRLLAYLAVAVLLVVFIFWLMLVSQGALIRITGRVNQKKATSFLDGIATSSGKFWTLVQLNIMAALLGWGLLVLLAGVPAAIYLINGLPAWSLVAHITTIVSVVVSAMIAFLVQYATAGIVLRDQTLMVAIIQSWRLFRQNLLVSVEMAVIIFLLNLATLFVVLGVTVLLVSPFSVAGLLTILIIIAIEYAIMSAFSFAAWTITYLRLVEGSAESKIGRWTTQLVNFTKPKQVPS